MLLGRVIGTVVPATLVDEGLSATPTALDPATRP